MILVGVTTRKYFAGRMWSAGAIMQSCREETKVLQTVKPISLVGMARRPRAVRAVCAWSSMVVADETWSNGSYGCLSGLVPEQIR